MQAEHPNLLTRMRTSVALNKGDMQQLFPLYNTEGLYTSCFCNWQQVIQKYCVYILRVAMSVQL